MLYRRLQADFCWPPMNLIRNLLWTLDLYRCSAYTIFWREPLLNLSAHRLCYCVSAVNSWVGEKVCQLNWQLKSHLQFSLRTRQALLTASPKQHCSFCFLFIQLQSIITDRASYPTSPFSSWDQAERWHELGLSSLWSNNLNNVL